MRSRALSCLVGGVLVSGAWLTGACGSTFVADMSQAGSGGALATPAGRNSGGDASGGGPMHLSKGGNDAGGQQGGSGSGSGSGGGSSNAGGPGNGGASAGNGGGGAGNGGAGGGAGAAGAGAAGAGAGGSGAGAGGGGASGAGAGGGGASGAGVGGGGAGGAGAGGGGASGISGGGAGGALSCVASTVTWMGCQAPSCGACKSAPELVNHPLYFPNHPSCIAIASCPDAHSACGATCPPPSDADLCNGSPGQWSGCQGTGCYVCEELVSGYPKYFEHHPNCVKNGTCLGPGHYGTCNAFCPAPVAADM